MNIYSDEFWDAEAAKLTDTSQILKLPWEEKIDSQNEILAKFDISSLTEGNYYIPNGMVIKTSQEPTSIYHNDVYIALPFSGGKLIDVMNWDFSQGYFWQRIPILHSHFKKYAGLVYNETRGLVYEEAFAIASSVRNNAGYITQYSDPDRTWMDYIEKIVDGQKTQYYTLTPPTLEASNSSNNSTCFAAVINIFTQNIDYSNGATHWDGQDFLTNGPNHIKVLSQGVEISSLHWESFKKSYTDKDGVGRKNFGKTNIKELPKLKIEATNPPNVGRILFRSIKQFGGHLFWSPNFNATENSGYDWKYLFFSVIWLLLSFTSSCSFVNDNEEASKNQLVDETSIEGKSRKNFGINILLNDLPQSNKDTLTNIITYLENKNIVECNILNNRKEAKYLIKLGNFFSKQLKHAIICQTTEKQDSTILYVLKKKKNGNIC